MDNDFVKNVLYFILQNIAHTDLFIHDGNTQWWADFLSQNELKFDEYCQRVVNGGMICPKIISDLQMALNNFNNRFKKEYPDYPDFEHIELFSVVNGFYEESVKWLDIINYYFTEQQQTTPEPKQCSMPDELNTPQAKEILNRGVKAGLLNTDYQPDKDTTKYQLYEFASMASNLLGIKNKWKVFGGLWSIKNLGQVKVLETNTDNLFIVHGCFQELGYDDNGRYNIKPKAYIPRDKY